ncbi:MAG: Ig domain-containing protein [Gaiellales bacterium]
MRRLRYLIICLSILGLALVPSALALKIATTPPPPGYVGVPYSFQFKPEDGQGCTPYSWKYLVGSLPPGLSVSADDGILSGTPTTVGDYTFYIELKSCAGNVTQRQFTMAITEKFRIVNQNLPDGNINVAYGPIQLSTAGGAASGGWSIAGGTIPAGVTLSTSGVVSGTPTESGDFEFIAKAVQSSTTSDTTKFKLHVNAPLALNGPGGLPVTKEPVPLNGKVATPFSWGVQAQGGKAPYSYSSTELPDGVTLDPVTGSVSGTPTSPFLGEVTFTVTDGAGGTDTIVARINIKALLAFSTTARPPAGKVGKAFRWKLPVTGASQTRIYVASGKYPPGLELDEATGIFAGTPLQAGSYRMKFWVLDDAGTQISKSYTIKIKA